MKRDWEMLTAASYADSVAEIKSALEAQDYDEVSTGLDALYESMSQEQRRALTSQLIRLMMHIIKWNIQPERRSSSWARSIANARYLIRQIMSEKPSLNRRFVEEKLWNDVFEQALYEAQLETNLTTRLSGLTWEAVFETEYRLPPRDA